MALLPFATWEKIKWEAMSQCGSVDDTLPANR